MENVYPFRRQIFLMLSDSKEVGEFSEVSSDFNSLEPIEYHEGIYGNNGFKQTGIMKTGTLILKWGVVDSDEFVEWRQFGFNNQSKRTITIQLCDNSKKAIKAWKFMNVSLIRYEIGDVKTTGNDIAIERLELSYEEIVEVSR